MVGWHPPRRARPGGIARCAGAWLLGAGVALGAGDVRAFDPEGTWYVLVHYRDGEAADPGAWLWEDRVWDFQRSGGDLLWTDYGLVNFMDIRGRFADLRSAWARRVRGAWEPNASQRREIERGLFVNPRGAQSLRLEAAEGGWRTRRSERAAPELALSLRRSAAITTEEGLPVFSIRESVHAADDVQRLKEATFRALSRRDDGGLEGDYEEGARRGRFRIVPTALREKVRPDIRREGRRLHLAPDSVEQWENLLPALARPWRYLGRREVAVESSPPDAFLDVSYLRNGARRLYEEARAPVTLVLPSRLVASVSDVVQLDAFAPGFRPERQVLALHDDVTSVRVELEPTANVLREAWFRALAGSASLVLFSEGPLDLQAARAPGRLTLVLADTSATDEATALLASLASPPVAAARVVQLRENLVLRLELRGRAEPEPRYLRVEDPTLEVHRTEVWLPAPADAPPWPARVKEASRAVTPDACDAAFERALRDGLGAAALTRALTLPDPRVDVLVEEALLALARGDAEGRVRLADGTALDPSDRVGLAMARSRAGEVGGLLAISARMLDALEPDPDEALRSLLAPQLSGSRVRAVLREACPRP